MEAIEKNKKISIRDIHPNLRIINLYPCKPGFYSGNRKLYDHYFLYVHKGQGCIFINNHEYMAVSGDLFYCPPTISNAIKADDNEPFLLTGINFDFTKDHRDNKLLYPIQAESFEPDYVTEYIRFIDFEGLPDKISLVDDMTIRELIYKMIQQFNEQKRFWDLSVNGMLQTFIATVIQRVTQKDAGGVSSFKGDEIIRFLAENYMHPLTNEEIARRFHYHPDHINRIVFTYTGMTLKQYIIDLRIRAAVNLLMQTDANISAIASKIGYDNVYYFSRLFKKRTGYAPSCFRQHVKKI